MLPEFDQHGNLPPGVHWASWRELTHRFGFTARRRNLLDGLIESLWLLREAGCRNVYLNGSFVTDKPAPGDFDACWDSDGVDFNRLDSIFRIDRDVTCRDQQKAKFGGELYPAEIASLSGNTLMEFFQIDRQGRRKGIVAISLEDLPDDSQPA